MVLKISEIDQNCVDLVDLVEEKIENLSEEIYDTEDLEDIDKNVVVHTVKDLEGLGEHLRFKVDPGLNIEGGVGRVGITEAIGGEDRRRERTVAVPTEAQQGETPPARERGTGSLAVIVIDGVAVTGQTGTKGKDRIRTSLTEADPLTEVTDRRTSVGEENLLTNHCGGASLLEPTGGQSGRTDIVRASRTTTRIGGDLPNLTVRAQSGKITIVKDRRMNLVNRDLTNVPVRVRTNRSSVVRDRRTNPNHKELQLRRLRDQNRRTDMVRICLGVDTGVPRSSDVTDDRLGVERVMNRSGVVEVTVGTV